MMRDDNCWQRLSRTKTGRRRFLAAATAASAAVALAACSGGKSGGEQNTPEADLTPRRGGRLQLASDANFISIDPHLTVGSGIAIVAWLYTYLFHYSGASPDIMLFDHAEEMEQPDEVTYRFKLRAGVRTPSGHPPIPERELDSQDVLKTFERVRDLPGATAGAFIKERVDSFSAPDGSTFIIKTKAPYAWALDSLGSPAGTGIVPRELIDSNVDLRTGGGGAGPFFLARYRDGEIASVDRNENYWAAPIPHIDGIDFKIIADRSARRNAFLSRQIDLYTPQNVREKDDLERNKQIIIDKEPSLAYVSPGMRADQAPFKDPRVRRAINRAIDRQAFIDKLAFGDGQPDGVVAWGLDFWALDQDEVAKLQPYDPQDARALLSAAGYADGLELETVYPSDESINDHVTILLEQMKAVGVTLRLQPLPLTAWYFDRYSQGKFTFTVAANLAYESPQIPLAFHHSGGPQGEGNWHGFSDPEVDAIIDRVGQTLEINERQRLVKEAQRLIMSKDPAMVNIFSGNNYNARWDYVRGTRALARSLALFNRDFWLAK